MPKLGPPIRAPDPLDELDVLSLRESPEALERVIADQQRQARTNRDLRDLLGTIFLEEDRGANFARFAQTRDFAATLRLLRIFGVTPTDNLAEVGGGPGFLTWALHSLGFQIDLLEPNALWNTGTGYLRSRPDAEQLRVFSDHLTWHADPVVYDALLTKNCIHHFQNIALVAVSLRQKLRPGGLWFALREWFADTPQELAEMMASHPHAQPFGLYEWPYPAHHYVEALEMAGFHLVGVVPFGYDNNCLGTFSEGEPSADVTRLTAQLDSDLASAPEVTTMAFWQEVQRNRFERKTDRLYTRPQAMVFRRIEL